MKLLRMAVGEYWIIYYLVYVAGVGLGVWLYQHRLHWEQVRDGDGIYLLAAIFGVSVGIALLAAIIVEVTGRMVLLIPRAWNKLKEDSRREGREAGREEGREEGREAGREAGREEARQESSERLKEAYERFGIEVDGVLTLPRTPEVERFLANQRDERS